MSPAVASGERRSGTPSRSRKAKAARRQSSGQVSAGSGTPATESRKRKNLADSGAQDLDLSKPDLCFLLLLTYCAAQLVAVAFVYSFSAFKQDLMGTFGWAEKEAAFVFTFANVGQNFVVHLGLLYDRFGAGATSALAALCKVFLQVFRNDAQILVGRRHYYSALLRSL